VESFSSNRSFPMGSIKHILFIMLMIAGVAVYSQPKNRYMVFFKDKAGSPYSKSDSLSFLSQRAIDRRLVQEISITDQDIPVNDSYVNGVKGLGAVTFFTSRWLNGILVQCNVTQKASIEALSFVDHVELVAPGEKLIPGGRSGNVLREKKAKATEVTLTQRKMIGLDVMHESNYHGEGKIIAIMDGGFPGVNTATPFQNLISEGRVDIPVSFDFVYNTSDVFQYDVHGTEVLSIMTALTDDTFIGGAYKANYQLYVTEDSDSEYRIEEYNWVFAAERADSAGADIINTSLGYYDFDDTSMNYELSDMDGKTTVITRAAQMAADRGIVVVCSAGNEGGIPSWRIITAPADAVDVIAVANVNAQGQKAHSSSIGPSADNRIKPDLAALGQNVSVILSNGNTSTASGTSVAAPLITSLVAGVWQHYPDLTNKEIIALLKKTASLASNPNNELGYGIPNFQSVINYQDWVTGEKLFTVYPNPVFNDTLYMRPSDPATMNSCTVEVLNLQGQLISSNQVEFSWSQPVYEHDFSGKSAGLYIVKVSSNNQRFTFKVIKR
jgi:serine protease AprX